MFIVSMENHYIMPLSFLPARMDRAHGRWRQVGVVLNGDCFLHMVLANVLIHLLYSQWLPILGHKKQLTAALPKNNVNSILLVSLIITV